MPALAVVAAGADVGAAAVLLGALVLAGWAVGLPGVAALAQAVATKSKTDARLKIAFLIMDLLLYANNLLLGDDAGEACKSYGGAA